MSEEELKLYYSILTKCWKLFRKYVQQEKIDDKVWNCMINEFEKLRREVEGVAPVYQILWGTQKALDEIWTKREKEKVTDDIDETTGFTV